MELELEYLFKRAKRVLENLENPFFQKRFVDEIKNTVEIFEEFAKIEKFYSYNKERWVSKFTKSL